MSDVEEFSAQSKKECSKMNMLINIFILQITALGTSIFKFV